MKAEEIEKKYRKWCEMAVEDYDLMQELANMNHRIELKEDAFYRELEFGTGGLRGIIGAGTNHMNVYTVAKASQGLANYIRKHYEKNELKIAVSYDSRTKSALFAKVASEVFAANDLRVMIYKNLMPTPCLSFAVRELDCVAGIMITASHNPSNYNGYKVYGFDGCQITVEVTDSILAEINRLDVFEDVKRTNFEKGVEERTISWISEDVYTGFIDAVKRQSLADNEMMDKSIPIIYTPLNGAGLQPILRVFNEIGYTNVTVVKEQEKPDGAFPTCKKPNPESADAMKLGIDYAKRYHAELVLATDPDCDRVGIAVKKQDEEYTLLSGNETGILLLDYICKQKIQTNTMPDNPCIVKTIVTTDMAEQIANDYGVETINVLTGFKYIGEQIGKLEREGNEESFILGFEESYGYLSGSYVRDKDAVGATLLICEMVAYYEKQHITLCDKLDELYQKYGYFENVLYSYEFEGIHGFKTMSSIMNSFRKNMQAFGKWNILQKIDYLKEINELPKADVLKFLLAENCSVVIRPSGTEPKIKVYISVKGKDKESAKALTTKLKKQIDFYIDSARNTGREGDNHGVKEINLNC